MKKRLGFIDALRGFSIFLIVFGHAIGYCDKLAFLSKYLSSFYVPLFFLLSGFVFKNNKDESFKDFFVKKFKKIMVPYFIFAFLSLIPYYLFANNLKANLDFDNPIGNNFFKSILYILYGSCHNDGLTQNSPLWFLPCYFVTILIAKVIASKGKVNNYFNMVIFLVLGYVVSNYFNFAFPYQLETSLVMLFFFYLGNSMAKIKFNKNWLWLAIVLLVLGGVISSFNPRISCMMNSYHNYFIFIIASCCSLVGYLLLFMFIKESRVLKYLGNVTIPILTVHKMPIVFMQAYLGVISKRLKTGLVFEQLLYGLIFSFIAILVSIIFYKVVNRYFPFVYGNSKKKLIS